VEAIKRIVTKTAISKIKYIGEDKFCVIDEENTIRMYSLQDYKLTGGFRIKLPKNRPLENSVDISTNGKYLAIAIDGKKKTSIWDIENKKQLYLLGWHKGNVLSVNFDKEERYILTGGEDGRAYLWSLLTGRMVGALPPNADYILSTGFSLNSLWAATGSYDKSITITNITSMDLSFKKRSHRGAVTKLEFISHHKMVSGDKTGELAIWNYTQGNVVKRLPNMMDMVIDIKANKDNNYLFAISTDKKVSLYSLEEYTLISHDFIKLLSQPSSIEYIPEKEYLLVGTLDGDIYIYDLLLNEKELKAFIKAKKYALAYDLINSNPFLKTGKAYKLLEDEWNKTLEIAHRFLEKGDIVSAKEFLQPFADVPFKRVIVQNLLNDFRDFDKFKKAVTTLKYPVAYSLANQYPSFKDTVYYKKMEEDWQKAFEVAKQAVLKENNIEKAKEILKPFRGVPQKTPLIQALFHERRLYDILKEKLMKKDFKEFFNLIKKFPFLIETEEYKNALKIAETIDKSIQLLLKQGEYRKVISYAQMLGEFPGYEDKAKDYIKKAQILMDFQRLLASKDLKAIFNYVKNNDFLEDVIDYKEFQNEIKEKLRLAEEFSAKGDIEGILKVSEDLFKIKEYEIRIANLIKSSYLQQIIHLLTLKLKGQKVEDKIAKAFKNYISFFGYDFEISDLIEKAKRLKINIDLSNVPKGDISTLMKKKLPSKIYE